MIPSDKNPLNAKLPLWLKVIYTIFVVVLVPVYWVEHGPSNFLWGSDIALLVTVVALWRENRFFISIMAVGVLLPELVWNIDFIARIIAGGDDVFGLSGTRYMYNPDIPLYVRSLSLFHVFMPAVLIFALLRLGYDSRGLLAQCILAWVVLPVSYFFTDPQRNINGVFGHGETIQTAMPGELYLLLLMVLYPALVYIPTHLILKKCIKN